MFFLHADLIDSIKEEKLQKSNSIKTQKRQASSINFTPKTTQKSPDTSIFKKPIVSQKKTRYSPVKKKFDGLEKKSLTRGIGPMKFKGIRFQGKVTEGIYKLFEKVEITQDDFQLYSDFAEIYLDIKTGEVEKAIATAQKGYVHVYKLDQKQGFLVHAISKKASFFSKQRLVILEGKVKLMKKNDIIQGEVIKYFLGTGVYEVQKAQGKIDMNPQLSNKK